MLTKILEQVAKEKTKVSVFTIPKTFQGVVVSYDEKYIQLQRNQGVAVISIDQVSALVVEGDKPFLW